MNSSKYADIITRPPVRPHDRVPQSPSARAAQFAPFAALKT